MPDYPDAPLIWAAALTVVAAAVSVRLAIEMRACRLAVVSLAVALASYAAVRAIELNWVLDGPGTFRVMAVAGFRFAATISLFLALCLYSRHVFRDASGEVSPKARRVASKARPRRKRDESAAPAKPVEPVAATPSRPSGAKIRIDSPHTTTTSADVTVPKPKPAAPKPADATTEIAKRRVSTPAVMAKAVVDSSDDESGHEESDQDDDDADGEKLSKAERRRLRKLQRRDRQQS
jgi:hypothetical protein